MKLFIAEKPSLARAVPTGIGDGKNCDDYRIIKAKILKTRMSIEEPESYIGTSYTTISSYVHAFQKKFFKKNFDFHYK